MPREPKVHQDGESLRPEKVPKEISQAIKARDRTKKKMAGRDIVDVVADEIRNQPKGR